MIRFDLSARTAFVTGAGSGIGREVAVSLGASGAAVACVDLSGAGAQATVDLITRQGGRAKAWPVDVARVAQVNAAVADAQQQLGSLDYLVNCAGIINTAPIEAMDDETWQTMLSVHLSGTFHTCRAVVPGMMARRFGAIVNTGSVFGVRGQANAVHYSAVKAGIAGFTKALAREKGGFGIRVNAVVPGPTMTPFYAAGVGKEGDAMRAAAAERGRALPLGVIATAAQVAASYLFLLSGAASHITGECLMVDGGEVMA